MKSPLYADYISPGPLNTHTHACGTQRQLRPKGQVLAESDSEDSSTPRRSERQPNTQTGSPFETNELLSDQEDDSDSEDEGGGPMISEEESDT
jgi:hypothetical protein